MINIKTLLLVTGSAVLFLVVYQITIKSIESLGYKFNLFYPFNKMVKKGNLWSSIFFLVIITLLTLVAYLIYRGFVPLTPA